MKCFFSCDIEYKRESAHIAIKLLGSLLQDINNEVKPCVIFCII